MPNEGAKDRLYNAAAILTAAQASTVRSQTAEELAAAFKLVLVALVRSKPSHAYDDALAANAADQIP